MSTNRADHERQKMNAPIIDEYLKMVFPHLFEGDGVKRTHSVLEVHTFTTHGDDGSIISQEVITRWRGENRINSWVSIGHSYRIIDDNK